MTPPTTPTVDVNEPEARERLLAELGDLLEDHDFARRRFVKSTIGALEMYVQLVRKEIADIKKYGNSLYADWANTKFELPPLSEA